MPAKIYKVTLMPEEQEYLTALISKGKAAARKSARARILLKADRSENGPARKDKDISESSDVSLSATERVRRAFIEEGFEAAINHKKPCGTRPVKSDGEKEAHLIAPACSQPPDGFKDRTSRLPADKTVEMNHFENLSYETVRQVLKKTNSDRG